MEVTVIGGKVTVAACEEAAAVSRKATDEFVSETMNGVMNGVGFK